MVTLLLFVHCLYCKVDVDLAWWGMSTVENVQIWRVNLKTRDLNEIYFCIDLKLDQRYSGCLDQSQTGNPRLLLQQLLKLFQSTSQPTAFRKMHEVIQNTIVNGNINITIFYRNARRTWAKQLDGYFPHTQNELNSLVGNEPSFIKLVCFLIYQVAILLNLWF